MRVLALDTTTSGGSAALVAGVRVLAEVAGNPARSQAAQLPGTLLGLLDSLGMTLRDVDVFAVASGPGSFTGLRIGIATIQGLASVTRKKVAPISALDALAHVASRGVPAGTIVAAWMDARRREIFSALYRVREGDDFQRSRLEILDPPSVGSPELTLERWRSMAAAPAVFAGDGAVEYSGLLAGCGRVLHIPTLAPAIGLLAVHDAEAGRDVDPGSVQPLYVRRPDAEIARDRHQSVG
jgi:tRNA threonylcarbamoyladenosine biosynthesis protein TsaB